MTHDDTLKRAAYLLREAAFSRSEGRMLAAKLETLAAELRIGIMTVAPQPAQVPEGWQLVPKEPTEPQWGGLARDIVMWLEMHPGPEKTPRALFLHLERLGRQIPDWLRNEPEMQALDHVPSKGTRATVIYKAMLAAAPQQKEKS